MPEEFKAIQLGCRQTFSLPAPGTPDERMKKAKVLDALLDVKNFAAAF